jgi:hypothetical protein
MIPLQTKVPWHVELYHSEGHSDYAGGREDEEVECGRMAG